MSDSSSELIDLVLDWFPALFGVGVLVAFTVWFIKGVGQHRRERQERIARSALAAKMPYSVYAKIVERIPPMVRAAKYEEPLKQALETAKLGVVTGGGTQMGKDGTIEWVGIDLALADLDGALQFTRQQLCDLGAPHGSLIEYFVGEQKMTVQIA